MSNLTKILIVLLTLSSIMLCGIVVTYVANADNFKEKYERTNSLQASAQQEKESLSTQLKEKIQQNDEREKSDKDQIAKLKIQADELNAKLNASTRQVNELIERTNSFAATTKDFQATTEKQAQLLASAQEEVKQLKAEQIKLTKELEQTSTAVVEKTALLEAAEADKRRLVEEKADLQNRMDKMLQGGARVAAAGGPVTQERGKAIAAAQTITDSSNIKGLISEIDAKRSWAALSIGQADGVKEGMKFHVTRGDEFICDLLIVDVDTDKAAGVLELVQQSPKVGDNASTIL